MSAPIYGSLKVCGECGRKILVEEVVNGTYHTLRIIVCCWDCLDEEKKNIAEAAYGVEQMEESDA